LGVEMVVIRSDEHGCVDYAALTATEAATLLTALPPDEEAAELSHYDWGGDYRAHLIAHQKHRAALVAASQRTGEA